MDSFLFARGPLLSSKNNIFFPGAQRPPPNPQRPRPTTSTGTSHHRRGQGTRTSRSEPSYLRKATPAHHSRHTRTRTRTPNTYCLLAHAGIRFHHFAYFSRGQSSALITPVKSLYANNFFCLTTFLIAFLRLVLKTLVFSLSFLWGRDFCVSVDLGCAYFGGLGGVMSCLGLI